MNIFSATLRRMTIGMLLLLVGTSASLAQQRGRTNSGNNDNSAPSDNRGNRNEGTRDRNDNNGRGSSTQPEQRRPDPTPPPTVIRPTTPPSNDQKPDRGGRGNDNRGNNDRWNDNRGNNDRGNNDHNRGNDNRGNNDRWNDNRGNNDHNRGNTVDWSRGNNGRPNDRWNDHDRYRRPNYNPRPEYFRYNDYGWMDWYRPIWQDRNRYFWASNYIFKQYVYMDNGWDYNGSELEIRTRIRQETRRSSFNNARIEFMITGIDLYQDGYLLGSVQNIPSYLGRVSATIMPSGRVDFDSMVYLVGDPYAGFELVNTRFSSSFLIGSILGYNRTRVGAIDLRARRVYDIRNSNYLNDRNYRDNAMVPLVPESDDWGLGYTVAGFDYRDDWYFDQRGYAYDDYKTRTGRTYRSAQSQGDRERAIPSKSDGFRNGNDQTFRSDSGTEVRLRRRVEIQKDGQ